MHIRQAGIPWQARACGSTDGSLRQAGLSSQAPRGRSINSSLRKLRSRGRLPCLLAAVIVALALLSVAPGQPSARAAAGSPAVTPPLGWNSFGCNVNETVVRQAADAMVSSGMRDAGYQYVVVDDCWFDPQRDAQGNLRGSPTKFLSGMKALGDYIHGRGLKFGIYEVPTERTCAQRVGTYPGTNNQWTSTGA